MVTLTSHNQKYLVILLSLLDLNGSGTKTQVLDNILEKEYLKLSAWDYEILSTRNEERWRNDLAYKRNELKEKGYMKSSQRGRWEITSAGILYAQSLAKQACTQTQWEKLTPNAVIRSQLEIREIINILKKKDFEANENIQSNNSDLFVAKNSPFLDSYVNYISKNVDEIEQLMMSMEKTCDNKAVFNPNNIEDARKRCISSIVRRRGQPAFRSKLLHLYQGQCAITNETFVHVLEAAHIISYKGENTNHPQNGLLLRSDIHTLFDLRLIAIDSTTMTVLTSPKLTNTSYNVFARKKINLPIDKQDWPSMEALDIHRREAGL